MDLVVYYSRTSNTKMVAQVIADETGAGLLEVKDKKSRSGVFGFAKGGFDALRGNKTDIRYDEVNLQDFDTVYIGTPVWASRPTPAIVQFIDENDFSGVNVVTFATMMGDGGDSTVEMMNDAIKAKEGNVLRSFSLVTKNKDIKELTLEALSND